MQQIIHSPATAGSDLGDGATKVLAEVQVAGFKKGWFLIEAGPYNTSDLPAQGPKPYTGRGWVTASMLTTELLRNMLKQGPSETSPTSSIWKSMTPAAMSRTLRAWPFAAGAAAAGMIQFDHGAASSTVLTASASD